MTIRRRTLPRLQSVVRPGGLFYARIPCVASLFRILQCIDLPVDFTYPAHFHDMAKTHWSSILRLLPPPTAALLGGLVLSFHRRDDTAKKSNAHSGRLRDESALAHLTATVISL